MKITDKIIIVDIETIIIFFVSNFCVRKSKNWHANNIKIGILTNGVREVQQNKFKCLNLENYVDGVIYAKLTGEEKPHQKPFNSICNLLGIPMRNTLMIGDDYKNDVLGALNAGMHSVFLNKYPSVKPVNSYKHSFSSIYDIVTEFIDE